MPLHPKVRALLDALPADAEMGLHTPEVARRRLAATAPIVTGGDDTMVVRDFEIAGPNGPIPVRSYLPRSYVSGGPVQAPVALHFHGGGFVTGSIDLYDANARDIAAKANCAVLAVGYRLAPEHPFPAGLNDCYAATEWVANEGHTIGLDGSRIAVGGSSAGAALALSVCLMAKDRNGPSIAFQFLIYPSGGPNLDTPSMRDNATGYWFTKVTHDWAWKHYLKSPQDATNPYVAPLLAPSLEGLPPALVITAEYDPLRDGGELVAAKLAQAGVYVRLTRYYGMIHGLFIFRGSVPAGADAMNEVACAIASALGTQPCITNG